MRYGSVCSGIESATVAWEPLGWEPKWFSEIDPFCCALLKHHYPKTPNMGSIFNVGVEHGPIDLLVGGTPCQAFSVNGKREGLADDRGKVTGEYLRLADVLRPRWVVWENVAGALSVGDGSVFGSIVGGLAKLGYGCCWRVLDLVGFGVPQQRRRLFLVGCAGGRWQCAGAVLLDPGAGGKHARPVLAVRQGGSPAYVGSPWPAGWTGDPTPKCCPGVALTLRSQQGGEGAGLCRPGEVRKYTPREWERLQGFADDYTLISFGGKPATDSRRKQAVGNSFPVPILSYIGTRIDYLERNHVCG